MNPKSNLRLGVIILIAAFAFAGALFLGVGWARYPLYLCVAAGVINIALGMISLSVSDKDDTRD